MRVIETASLLLALPSQEKTINGVTLDGTIMALWKQGLDTLSIAKTLGRHDYPESRVYNRLAALRDEARA